MLNHFHLVLETPQPNLVAGMKWLLGIYTRRYNRRHKKFGHLFASGKDKSNKCKAKAKKCLAFISATRLNGAQLYEGLLA